MDMKFFGEKIWCGVDNGVNIFIKHGKVTILHITFNMRWSQRTQWDKYIQMSVQ